MENAPKYITEAGSLYDPARNVADTAKLVRKDIAALRKAGIISPDLKISVKISRFSMGQSINIKVCNWADVHGPARVEIDHENYGTIWARTDDAAAHVALFESVLAAYNWVQTSDQPDDYHACQFFAEVNL